MTGTRRQETGPGVRVAATAQPDGVKELIDRFMLDRLGLRPLSLWGAEAGAPKDADGNRDSTEQVHGWASYFYAIALNSGNSSILLGPTGHNQLPVKLMQLFLDVPYASELTQITTARKKDTQESNRVERRAREDAEAREEQTDKRPVPADGHRRDGPGAGPRQHHTQARAGHPRRRRKAGPVPAHPGEVRARHDRHHLAGVGCDPRDRDGDRFVLRQDAAPAATVVERVRQFRMSAGRRGGL
jgi:hypothetical protein